jgi:hypothetical protein
LNKISTEKLLNSFQGAQGLFKEPGDLLENTSPHYLVFPASQYGVIAGRRRGVEATESRSPGFIVSCSYRVPEVSKRLTLIFKTSTEDQTVHLTNKDMTKDSERFSPWFHTEGLENNRSDPLTCICRWTHEGADLW